MASISKSPAEICLSKNPVTFQFEESTPLADNYSLRVTVEIEDTWDSGTYEEVVKVDLLPNSAGIMTIDLQNILDREIDRSYASDPIPSPTISAPVVVDNVRRYRVKYEEISGNPPMVSGSPTTSAEFIIVKGGVSDEEWIRTEGKWMLDGEGGYEFGVKSLLNWYPKVKTIGFKQADFLAYFGSDAGGHVVGLTVDRYEDNGDGTYSKVTDTFFQTTACDTYQTVLFPISPQLLNCTVNTRRMDIYCNSASHKASEVKTFLIDHLDYEDTYYIMYLNGFNMPGIIQCTGKRVNSLSVSRTKSSRIKGSNLATLTRAITQVSSTFEDTYIYRTGYMTKEEAESLKELLLYNKIFHVEKSVYYPLDIIDDRFKISEDGDFLHFIEFTAVRTLKKKAYSETPYQDPREFWEEEDGGLWAEDSPDDQFWEHP